MKPNSISAIIPTYNRAHILPRAIESALSHSDPGDEVIVVDDGSIDNTPDLAMRFGDRIRYIRTENRGAGAARNRGIREANCPLVVFLDSDDEWMPGHNSLLRAFMTARSDLLFCFTNYAARFIDGRERRFALESQHGRELDWGKIMGPSNPASTFISLPKEFQDFPCYEGDNLYVSECANSYVCVNAMIVRREEAGENLRFAEDTPTLEEWECGARLARAGRSAYLHCETAWAIHHTGERLTDSDMFAFASARVTFMRRIWGADEEFLRNHKELYSRLLRTEQLLRIEGLLLRGRTAEARAELAAIPDVPLAHSLLSRLPGRLAKGILDGRRAIRSLARK